MVVGASEFDRAERGEEGLGAAAGVTGRLSTGTPQTGSLPVGTVSVEPVLDGECGKLQGTAPCGGLDGLQVQRTVRAAAQQRFDLSLDVGGERGAESFLTAPVASSAARVSHSRSLTSISSPVKRRRRWHSST